MFLCNSSGLLHHSDQGTPNLDALFRRFECENNVPGHRITTDDLKSMILALQKDYTSTLKTLRSDFEVSLRSQQNRILYLEKKVAHHEKLRTILKSGAENLQVVRDNQKKKSTVTRIHYKRLLRSS